MKNGFQKCRIIYLVMRKFNHYQWTFTHPSEQRHLVSKVIVVSIGDLSSDSSFGLCSTDIQLWMISIAASRSQDCQSHRFKSLHHRTSYNVLRTETSRVFPNETNGNKHSGLRQVIFCIAGFTRGVSASRHGNIYTKFRLSGRRLENQ